MTKPYLYRLLLLFLLALPNLAKSQCQSNFFITPDPINAQLNTECWLGGLLDSIGGGWGRNGYYEVPVEPQATYNWTVNGGSILNGQGTTRIQVRWNEISNSLTSPSNTNISVSVNSLSCSYFDQYYEVTGDPSWNGAGFIAAGPDTACIGDTVLYTNNYCSYNPCPVISDYILEGGDLVAGVTPTVGQQGGGSCNPSGMELKDSLYIRWTSSPAKIWGMEGFLCVQCGPIDYREIVLLGEILGPETACIGDTALYTTIGRPSGSFLWTVTSGTIISGQGTDSLLVHWPGSGVGTVQLNYSDGVCDSEWSDSISILPPPMASVITGPDTICGSMASTYSIPYTPGHQYQWTVSGATILSGQDSSTVVIQPNSNGSIQLTVFDSAGSCTAPSGKTVVNSFQVMGINGPQYACSGLATNYDISTNCTGCTSTWLASNGNILSGQGTDSVAVAWTAGSSPQLSVIVSTGQCSDTLSYSPGLASHTPPFDLGPDSTYCNINNLTLDLGPPSNPFLFYSYTWSVTGVFSQTLTVNSPGTYIGSIAYKYPSLICTYSDTITLSETAAANLDLGPDTSLCSASSLILSVDPNLDSIIWSNGSTANTNLVLAPGSYWVETYDSLGCVNRDSINLLAFPTQPADLGPDTDFCPGDSLALQTNTIYANYNWSTGSTDSAITVLQPGIYWVETIDSFGCLSLDSINISTFPNTPISLGADTSICPGDSLTLQASSGFNTYNWSTGGNTSTITVGQQGSYWVEGIDGNGCSALDSIQVGFLPGIPTAYGAILADSCPLIYFTDSSQGTATTWFWDFGDGMISTAQNPSHDYTSAGNNPYIVTLIAGNTCGSDTFLFPIVINCLVGIVSGRDLDITLWPNPNDGIFRVKGLLTHPSEIKMEVVDLQGKVIYQTELGGLHQELDERIQIPAIAKGTYFLRVYVNGIPVEKTFVVGQGKG